MLLIAQNMGREKCCNQFCLSGMNMTEATNIMLACLQELKCFTKKEKKQYMHQKILHTCWTGKYTDKGYNKYLWKIGLGKFSKSDVCREAFMISYDIKPTYMQEICHHIKLENINMDSNVSNQQNEIGSDKSNLAYNELIKFARQRGIKLTIQQLAAM